MTKDEEVRSLIDHYGSLCYRAGSFKMYIQTSANVTETIVIEEQLIGINRVLGLVYDAILTYTDSEPDEQKILENILGA